MKQKGIKDYGVIKNELIKYVAHGKQSKAHLDNGG